MREQEINRYWKRIINTMNDGLMLIGPDGSILMANHAFEELTGYMADEVIGQTHTDRLWWAWVNAGRDRVRKRLTPPVMDRIQADIDAQPEATPLATTTPPAPGRPTVPPGPVAFDSYGRQRGRTENTRKEVAPSPQADGQTPGRCAGQ